MNFQHFTIGDYSMLALNGGVIGINIEWNCNLDWDFQKYCLPKYTFQILDDGGRNFRYANFHEEHRRTLIKAYGLKFTLKVSGKAGKFDLSNAFIILVTGMGLMGLANLLCELILLKTSNQFRKEVVEKKYENVRVDETTKDHLRVLLQKGNTSENIFNTWNSISKSIALEDMSDGKDISQIKKDKDCEEDISNYNEDPISVHNDEIFIP